MSDLHENSPKPFMPPLTAACLPLTAEKELELRKAVVAQAERWIGTPYHQQADIIGAGIDCSMLLVRCWVDAGVVEPFDPRPYPPNWHMHRSDERYLDWMNTVAVEVDEARVGDVAIYTFGRCFSHGGIITAPNEIVNASMPHGVCLKSNMNEPWLMWFDRKGTRPRPRKFFDIFAMIRRKAEGVA